MKIFYCSDLHLEFGALNGPLPSGDVLLLDGDITLLNAFDPNNAHYHHGRVLRERTLAFLDQCRDSFERIFYVLGNHEPYHYNISRAPAVIKKWKGVTLVENKTVDLGNDVLLVGGTLWTDMNKGRDAWLVGLGMNDFQVVRIDAKNNDAHFAGTRTFRPEDAMALFRRTLRYIARAANNNPNKTIVVVTHHAPSIQGINPIHSRSHINAGYYTDLHAFIAEHSNIRYWVHGHTHVQKVYSVHQCMVMSNARGYIGREACADMFKMNRWFDPVSDAASHNARRCRAPANAKTETALPESS